MRGSVRETTIRGGAKGTPNQFVLPKNTFYKVLIINQLKNNSDPPIPAFDPLGPLKLSRIHPLWAKPMDLQRSVRGRPEQKQIKLAYFKVFSPPHSKTINSHVTIRSVV